jgi:flagellar hook-associated protein 2
MSTSVTTPTSSTTTVAPQAFTGVSKFASSLQQVLTRAEGIAALPLQTLEAGLTTLDSTQSALQNMDATFSSLQESIGSLQSALSSNLVTASVSDNTVSASAGSGATPGNYSIEVDKLGAYSTALSVAGSTAVSDPANQGISTSTGYTLDVNGTETQITAASSSLQDLASAINSQAGAQVQATIVNVGSSGQADYRLSLQTVKLGDLSLDLTDSSSDDLISSSSGGTLASYTVNGQSQPITSSSRTVTLSPGLTVNLLAQNTTGEPTTITVSNDPSGLSSAFNSFASAYNAAVNAVSAQHGENAGALQGDSLLDTLTGVLNELGTWNNGTPESALANYGITLDSTGRMSVDTSVFTAAANGNFSGLLATLGSSGTGGFMQAAVNLLAGLEGPTTGAIKQEETSVANGISHQQNQINYAQTQLNQLESNLTQQIAQADSTIAALETQVTMVTGLFASFTNSNNNSTNGLQTL